MARERERTRVREREWECHIVLLNLLPNLNIFQSKYSKGFFCQKVKEWNQTFIGETINASKTKGRIRLGHGEKPVDWFLKSASYTQKHLFLHRFLWSGINEVSCVSISGLVELFFLNKNYIVREVKKKKKKKLGWSKVGFAEKKRKKPPKTKILL